MEGRPFALIGVNSDKTVARAKQAIAENQLNWRSFQNQEEGRPQAIAEDWGVRGWPTLIVLDRELRVQYRGHNGHEATQIAERLVAQSEAEQEGGTKDGE